MATKVRGWLESDDYDDHASDSSIFVGNVIREFIIFQLLLVEQPDLFQLSLYRFVCVQIWFVEPTH